MNRRKINALLKSDLPVENVLIKGWVRTRRNSKTFSFIEVNDGSCLKNIQLVVDESMPAYSNVKNVTTGCAIAAWGNMVASKGGGQQWEIQTKKIELIGPAPESFPLQKKRHGDD